MADDVRKIRAERPVKQGGISIGAGNSVQFGGGSEASPEDLVILNARLDGRFDETTYYWGEAGPPEDDSLDAVSPYGEGSMEGMDLSLIINWELPTIHPSGYKVLVSLNSYIIETDDDENAAIYYVDGDSTSLEIIDVGGNPITNYTGYYFKVQPYNTTSGDYNDYAELDTVFGTRSALVPFSIVEEGQEARGIVLNVIVTQTASSPPECYVYFDDNETTPSLYEIDFRPSAGLDGFGDPSPWYPETGGGYPVIGGMAGLEGSQAYARVRAIVVVDEEATSYGAWSAWSPRIALA